MRRCATVSQDSTHTGKFGAGGAREQEASCSRQEEEGKKKNNKWKGCCAQRIALEYSEFRPVAAPSQRGVATIPRAESAAANV